MIRPDQANRTFPLATWEVVRIQQSGFCEFPASRKFPCDELYIKMIHFSQNGRIRNKK